MRSLRRHPAESSPGALRHPGFGLSASKPGLHPPRLPSRLTSRSSRPRIVASAACFTLRLHASAAPPRGGLTQALGGSNPCAVHRDRLARCSGHFHAVAVFNCCACSVRQSCNASVSSYGALTLHMRCVHRLRNQRASSVSFPTPDPLLRRRPAGSFRGALGSSRFGFR